MANKNESEWFNDFFDTLNKEDNMEQEQPLLGWDDDWDVDWNDDNNYDNNNSNKNNNNDNNNDNNTPGEVDLVVHNDVPKDDIKGDIKDEMDDDNGNIDDSPEVTDGMMGKSVQHSKSFFDDEEGIRELKIMYKKLGMFSIFVLIIAIITLIFANYTGFYSLRGIYFHIILLIFICFGIFLSFYNEQNCIKATLKLKLLLSYFMLTFVCCILMFIGQIVYIVLIPIRKAQDGESIYVVIMLGISLLVGSIIWLILAAFYIDVIARASLKRGRIERIVNDIKPSSMKQCCSWFKIYMIIFWFRVNFRRVRIWITNFTGVKCISLNNKIHEEDKQTNVLNEPGGYNIEYNPPRFKGNYKRKTYCNTLSYKCSVCCYDTKYCCGNIFGRFINAFKNCECNAGLLCKLFSGSICFLLIVYIFFPLILWGFFFGLICFIIGLPVGLCCAKICYDMMDAECLTVLMGIGLFICGCISSTIWYLLWSRVICQNSELNTEKFYETQCYIWEIVFQIAVEALGD